MGNIWEIHGKYMKNTWKNHVSTISEKRAFSKKWAPIFLKKNAPAGMLPVGAPNLYAAGFIDINTNIQNIKYKIPIHIQIQILILIHNGFLTPNPDDTLRTQKWSPTWTQKSRKS